MKFEILHITTYYLLLRFLIKYEPPLNIIKDCKTIFLYTYVFNGVIFRVYNNQIEIKALN